jgi:hypothetical protein
VRLLTAHRLAISLCSTGVSIGIDAVLAAQARFSSGALQGRTPLNVQPIDNKSLAGKAF